MVLMLEYYLELTYNENVKVAKVEMLPSDKELRKIFLAITMTS